MNSENLIKDSIAKIEVLNNEYLLMPNWQWLALVAIIVSGFLLHFIFHFVWIKVFHLASKTKGKWDDELLEVIEPYVGKVLKGVFWLYTIPLVKLALEVEKVSLFVVKIYLAYGLIMIVYSSNDVWINFLKRSYEKRGIEVEEQVYQLLRKSLKVFTVIFGVLIVVQNLGLNVMSLLAGLGIGGLAFALAAQDTCANFFGSIMILLDKPFGVGDFIKVDSVEGTVEEVGFRSTKVRTFYNSQVIIPNAQLAKSNVDNLGRRGHRRTLCHLGLEYSTPPAKMEDFIDGVKEILSNTENLDHERSHVAFDSYGNFSLNILLMFHVLDRGFAEDLKARQDIFLKIYKKAEEVGVGFAFPTQTLHLKK